ncbi:hypothetical protein ACODT3_10705 [Streptomyces sp. 4.24]|uniref:hypothetical protein n=1 Tax=Streptomyces tritrimontium TaxID=3406573 RepID=UPI003BB6CE95
MRFTLHKTPAAIESAWAEHGARQRIVTDYFGARTKAEREAARRAAIEYDVANPETGGLVDELDGDYAEAA